MAVIQMVSFPSGVLGPRAESHPDGTVTYDYGTFTDGSPRPSSGTLEHIVSRHMREYGLSEPNAVAWLLEHGWNNGHDLAIPGASARI